MSLTPRLKKCYFQESEKGVQATSLWKWITGNSGTGWLDKHDVVPCKKWNVQCTRVHFTVANTGQVTFYKVPNKYDHVYLGLYYNLIFSFCESLNQGKKINYFICSGRHQYNYHLLFLWYLFFRWNLLMLLKHIFKLKKKKKNLIGRFILGYLRCFSDRRGRVLRF